MIEKNLCVFYADDDADDQALFKEVIPEINNSLELHVQKDGDELLSVLAANSLQPSLVFLDLNMPGKNGFRVLKEIRESEKHKNLPVVIFTTSDDIRDVNETRRLGANFFITKPQVYSLLKEALAYALSINWSSFQVENENFVYKSR